MEDIACDNAAKIEGPQRLCAVYVHGLVAINTVAFSTMKYGLAHTTITRKLVKHYLIQKSPAISFFIWTSSMGIVTTLNSKKQVGVRNVQSRRF